MRFRFEKKRAHFHGYSTGSFFDSFRRALNTGKDAKYTVSSSPKRFHSQTEEESFRIQAELSRNNALLYEVMIPPR
jgi:hypothetical protein